MDYENDVHLEKFPLEESAEFYTKKGVPLPMHVSGRAANVAAKRRAKKQKKHERLKALSPLALVRRIFPAKEADGAESQAPETDDWEQTTC